MVESPADQAALWNWLHIALWEAVLTELSFLLFFMVYTVAFTWCFDHLFGLPESALTLYQAVTYLASAPKSNSALLAYAERWARDHHCRHVDRHGPWPRVRQELRAHAFGEPSAEVGNRRGRDADGGDPAVGA